MPFSPSTNPSVPTLIIPRALQQLAIGTGCAVELHQAEEAPSGQLAAWKPSCELVVDFQVKHVVWRGTCELFILGTKISLWEKIPVAESPEGSRDAWIQVFSHPLPIQVDWACLSPCGKFIATLSAAASEDHVRIYQVSKCYTGSDSNFALGSLLGRSYHSSFRSLSTDMILRYWRIRVPSGPIKRLEWCPIQHHHPPPTGEAIEAAAASGPMLLLSTRGGREYYYAWDEKDDFSCVIARNARADTAIPGEMHWWCHPRGLDDAMDPFPASDSSPMAPHHAPVAIALPGKEAEGQPTFCKVHSFGRAESSLVFLDRLIHLSCDLQVLSREGSLVRFQPGICCVVDSQSHQLLVYQQESQSSNLDALRVGYQLACQINYFAHELTGFHPSRQGDFGVLSTGDSSTWLVHLDKPDALLLRPHRKIDGIRNVLPSSLFNAIYLIDLAGNLLLQDSTSHRILLEGLNLAKVVSEVQVGDLQDAQSLVVKLVTLDTAGCVGIHILSAPRGEDQLAGCRIVPGTHLDLALPAGSHCQAIGAGQSTILLSSLDGIVDATIIEGTSGQNRQLGRLAFAHSHRRLITSSLGVGIGLQSLEGGRDDGSSSFDVFVLTPQEDGLLAWLKGDGSSCGEVLGACWSRNQFPVLVARDGLYQCQIVLDPSGDECLAMFPPRRWPPSISLMLADAEDPFRPLAFDDHNRLSAIVRGSLVYLDWALPGEETGSSHLKPLPERIQLLYEINEILGNQFAPLPSRPEGSSSPLSGKSNPSNNDANGDDGSEDTSTKEADFSFFDLEGASDAIPTRFKSPSTAEETNEERKGTKDDNQDSQGPQIHIPKEALATKGNVLEWTKGAFARYLDAADYEAVKFLSIRQYYMLCNALDETLGFEYFSAMYSDAQQFIVAKIVKLSADGFLDWKCLSDYGLGYWIRSKELLRQALEDAARQNFSKGQEPSICAIIYILLGRQAVLPSLWKRQDSKFAEKLGALAKFDLTAAPERQSTAVKNAFAALSKHEYKLAVMFFLLADRSRDAIKVCIERLKDAHLAFLICRMLGKFSKSSVGAPHRNQQLMILERTRLESEKSLLEIVWSSPEAPTFVRMIVRRFAFPDEDWISIFEVHFASQLSRTTHSPNCKQKCLDRESRHRPPRARICFILALCLVLHRPVPGLEVWSCLKELSACGNFELAEALCRTQAPQSAQVPDHLMTLFKIYRQRRQLYSLPKD